MIPKKIIILLVVLLLIGVGVSAFVISTKKTPSNNSVVVPTTTGTSQKSTTQQVQNQNSQIAEGCTITPYNGTKLEFGDVVTDVRGGAICHFTIYNSLPVYNFYLRGNVEYNTIDQIEITKGIESKILVQKLEAGMGEPPVSGENFFGAQDMNFDGYKDIRLMSWWGATGNTGYTYWLFDPSKNIFVENSDLSSLSNSTPELQTKTIATHSVGGMAGCIYNNATYKFDGNGKLILIHSEKQDWVEESKSFIKTIGELKDGKIVTSTVAGDCGNL